MSEANVPDFLNHVTISGRVGRPQELKYTTNGTAILEVSVAHNKPLKRDGAWTKKTVWLNVVLIGPTAERLQPRLYQGRPVIVEGSLDQDEWTDKRSGYQRRKDKVLARAVHCLDRPVSAQSGLESGEGHAPKNDAAENDNSNRRPVAGENGPRKAQEQSEFAHGAQRQGPPAATPTQHRSQSEPEWSRAEAEPEPDDDIPF